MKKFDVIIVGAGPSGIFAALELLKSNKKLSILIIEKGKDIDKRACPVKIKNISCTACTECDLLSGWGGAGAFSDGKLSLSPEVGGFLSRYMDKDEVRSLINYVDGIYLKYGAPAEIFGDNTEEVHELEKLSSMNSLVLIPSKIRHIGTDRCRLLLKRIREDISSSIETIFQTEAGTVLIEDGKYSGVKLKD